MMGIRSFPSRGSPRKLKLTPSTHAETPQRDGFTPAQNMILSVLPCSTKRVEKAHTGRRVVRRIPSNYNQIVNQGSGRNLLV
jgi:hypothetical protein